MASRWTWPSTFHDQQMAVSGGTQYVRLGGHGPAVLLLHGFGDTGDMWIPLAEILVKDHTVIVPDLRGMGLSSHQDGGYEKTAQARDLAGILDKLGVQNVALVTHDIGNMVGYALAALYPARVTRWVVMDAPLPGIGHWDDQLKNPKVWHFNFRGPDVERLVAGRERILLDRFYNELSATPASIDEETRDHYAALYARPGAIHDAFSGQFAAFAQDAIDNQTLVAQRQADASGARHRRRSFLWRPPGDGSRLCRRQRSQRGHHQFGPLDHGGTAPAGYRRHRSVPEREKIARSKHRVGKGGDAC